MRYHNITKDDMLNGSGLRVVLWVSGCSHGCRGCHNPVTWDPDCGLIFDETAEEELFAELEKPYISGVTFSGGDPLYPSNRQEIGELMGRIREKFPGKNIWIYTGYRWEEICGLDFIQLADVVVDGEYEEALRDEQYHWAGSTNQRVIDVKKTLAAGEPVMYN